LVNAQPQSRIPAIIAGIVSFLVGLFIGWVVLGWLLFPVKWVGGDLTTVDSSLQEDYMRAAIDSYTQNGDDALAEWRFNNLGEVGPQMLAWIYANPNEQDPAQIQAYATAVGQDAALQSPPPAAPAASQGASGLRSMFSVPILAVLCLLILLGGLGILLIVWIIRRGKRPVESKVEPGVEPGIAPGVEPGSEDVVIPPSVISDEPLLIDNSVALEDNLPPVQEEIREAEPAEELPEWLREIAPSPAETVRLEEDVTGQAATGETTEADRFTFDDELGDESLGRPAAAATVVAAAALAADGTPNKPLPPEETLTRPLPPEETLQLSEAPTETAEETQAKFSRDIETLKNIGTENGEKLKAAGIHSPLLLLRKGATRQGRREVAQQTGIDEKLILQWVNYVDLFRIRGIGPEFADLLEQAGVDTVVELATRNTNNLYQQVVKINQERKLVRQTPSLTQVASWVDQAHKLPRTITY
jgi:predicted flap endonuclease-1-like 5' DNA nuclease